MSMFALLCADRLVLMTIITLFRESPRFKGALIFRSVHAARVHLRAAHNFSRRLFQATGCLHPTFARCPLIGGRGWDLRWKRRNLEKKFSGKLKKKLKSAGRIKSTADA